MRLAQEEHAQPGLADTAADGQGQLALQQHSVEGQLPTLLAAGGGQLLVQSGGVHPDTHGGQFKSPLQHRVPHQNIPVEAPVVIVWGPAVVGLARLQGAADAHEEGHWMLPYPGILPFLGAALRPAVLQLLGGDKGDLLLHQGQSGELGKHREEGALGLPHGGNDGVHRLPQIGLVPVPGGDHLLPVPLIHVDRVEVVQLLIPADGVHVGIQALTHGELVAVQGHALPLGQGVYHLGVPPNGGYVKGDGALHPVEIVVQAGGCLHEQRGGHPAQMQRTAQGVLKQAVEQTDGLLGIVQVQAGGVPLGDNSLKHKAGSFSGDMDITLLHYTGKACRGQGRSWKSTVAHRRYIN